MYHSMLKSVIYRSNFVRLGCCLSVTKFMFCRKRYLRFLLHINFLYHYSYIDLFYAQ